MLAANSRRQTPPRHSPRPASSKHKSSAGRDAWSPEQGNSSREIRREAQRPAPPLLPAPCLSPSHPPAPTSAASPPPASFSNSACARKTSKDPPRSTARLRYPPPRDRTSPPLRVTHPPDFPIT